MTDTETRISEAERGVLPPALLPVAAPLVCANCATPLAGPYCSTCGQHVADLHRSVWRFVTDFLDNTICWDNKLLRTLEPLFKQPGFLTQEFMAGRRMRYVHPLRLFLFTSAVCLALLKYGHDVNRAETRAEPTHKARRGAHVQPIIVPDPPSNPDPAPTAFKPEAAQPDATPTSPADKKAKAEDEDNARDGDEALGRAIASTVTAGLNAAKNKDGEAKLEEAAAKLEEASRKMEGTSNRVARTADRFANEKAEHLSWVALALLPLFALGLRALYRNEDRFYFEHLIFSLHYHVFLLLFWTSYVAVLAVASYLPLHGLFESVVRLGLLLPPVYLYLALRRIYAEGQGKTAVKTLILGSAHLLAIVVGVAIGAPNSL